LGGIHPPYPPGSAHSSCTKSITWNGGSMREPLGSLRLGSLSIS